MKYILQYTKKNLRKSVFIQIIIATRFIGQKQYLERYLQFLGFMNLLFNLPFFNYTCDKFSPNRLARLAIATPHAQLTPRGFGLSGGRKSSPQTTCRHYGLCRAVCAVNGDKKAVLDTNVAHPMRVRVPSFNNTHTYLTMHLGNNTVCAPSTCWLSSQNDDAGRIIYDL